MLTLPAAEPPFKGVVCHGSRRDTLGCVVDEATQALVRAQARIGTSLRGDKYAIERLLGVGAMGAVYAATHRNGMRVAVKVLHPELSGLPEVRRRFLREGYIANRIDHPGAVKVIDDDVDNDGTTFLVMELLEGRTVEHEWQSAGGLLSPARVAVLADRVLDVLTAVHGEGIVHRDVKPDNIFLTAGGGLKLLDLGIARLLESQSHTASGQVMGTPGFAAPEQAGGSVSQIDARTDLYSVGAMMFTLITGQLVHLGSSGMEQMIRAATTPARSVFDVWPEAPPAFANVIDVALSFDKTKRWTDAAQMRRALESALRLLKHDVALDSTIAAQRPGATGVTGTLVMGNAESEHAIPLAVRKKP